MLMLYAAFPYTHYSLLSYSLLDTFQKAITSNFLLMKVENTTFITINYKAIALVLVVMVASNGFTFWLSNAIYQKTQYIAKPNELYLLSQAKAYVYDLYDFEQKVRQVSRQLKIAPEWLMAVMHAESKFDASIKNFKGSGATGLIQFMPKTAKDFNITTTQLSNMNHVQQLDYVYQYLNRQRKKYKEYYSLTDLYLAILYPKALAQDFCYTLYANPSKAYQMNAGLDQDKDGNVTVQDIDKYLKRKYPAAYVVSKPKPSAYAKMLTWAGF